MAQGTRIRLDPAARRAQLVALGVEMLGARPLEAVAIEEIAAAAGISRGLLFHYFPTKRDFHEAVVRAFTEEMLQRTAPDPALPFIDQLRNGVEAFVDYVSENSEVYISLVRGAAGGSPALQAIFEDTRAAIATRINDRLGADTSPPRVMLAIRGWVAFAEEATIHWLTDRVPELDRDGLVDLLDRSLISLVQLAVAAEPSRRGRGR